jgi:hypothetical protein
LGEFEYSFDIGKQYNVKYVKRILLYKLPSNRVDLFYKWDEEFHKDVLVTKKASFYRMPGDASIKKISLKNVLEDLKDTKYEKDLISIRLLNSNLNKFIILQMLTSTILLATDSSGGQGKDVFGSIGDYFMLTKKPAIAMGFISAGAFIWVKKKLFHKTRNVLYQFDRE